MKLKILIILAIALALSPAAYSAAADYFISETLDTSSFLANPQALAVIPGGFVIIDKASPASLLAFILDGQGNLMNETNASSTSVFNLSILGLSRITGIRNYNKTGDQMTFALLDDIGKRITFVNGSNMSNRFSSSFVPSPGNISSAESVVGMCTDTSSFWIALGVSNLIAEYGGGGNNSVYQSLNYSILGTTTVGGLDCSDGRNGGNSELLILDDRNGLVYVTDDNTTLVEFVNLSSLSGRGLNTFPDIALLTNLSVHRPDFYAINNATKVIYHINKRPSSVLNVFEPDVSWDYPNANDVFNTRFSTVDVQINFTIFQPNNTASLFSIADEINCSVLVNDTLNSTLIVKGINNASINRTINITFGEGDVKLSLECLANSTYARRYSDFRLMTVNVFKHIFWMNDNFTVYYDSTDNSFKAILGINQSGISAAFNITIDEPVAIRVIWNNVTKNRSIYIDGQLKASDLFYSWDIPRTNRLYLLSRNDSGQANAILSYVQTSLDSSDSKYLPGSFISSWVSAVKDLADRFGSSRFWQFRATLRRGLSSENPVLRFVNISFDNTLMNFSLEPDVDFLDFSFSSATSSAIPAGQTNTVPSFTIWNIGNVTFDLIVKSLTPFDSCFNTGLFNSSALAFGNISNAINLSENGQAFTSLSPGENASVWLNVSASGCTAKSEFFDIDFSTSP